GAEAGAVEVVLGEVGQVHRAVAGREAGLAAVRLPQRLVVGHRHQDRQRDAELGRRGGEGGLSGGGVGGGGGAGRGAGGGGGQRGWKRQPAGMAAESGVSPDRITGSVAALFPASATTDSRALVYGCRGSVRTSSTVPVSTTRPRYITATRSAMFHASPRSCV